MTNSLAGRMAAKIKIRDTILDRPYRFDFGNVTTLRKLIEENLKTLRAWRVKKVTKSGKESYRYYLMTVEDDPEIQIPKSVFEWTEQKLEERNIL
jgi:hypothetical protein